MKGLIAKDLINLSKSFRMVGALSVFYGVIGFASDSPSSFSGMFTIVFAMLLFSTYSLDEMASKAESLFHQFEIPIGGAVLILIFYSIMIPIISKLGITKARIYLLVLYMVPFLLGTLAIKIAKGIRSTPPDIVVRTVNFVMENAYIIIPSVLVCVLGLSYIISIKIYRKTEF